MKLVIASILSVGLLAACGENPHILGPDPVVGDERDNLATNMRVLIAMRAGGQNKRLRGPSEHRSTQSAAGSTEGGA